MYLDLTDGKGVKVTTADDRLYGQTHLICLSDEAGNNIWLTPREANAVAALLSDAASMIPAELDFSSPALLDLKTGSLR